MGFKSWLRDRTKPLRRRLWPARRWYEYQRRLQGMRCFRLGADFLRLLRVLPQRSKEGQPMRLLIVNLTPHLGDTIMQMPMIEALRTANPTARIEYAVEESAAPLLRLMPQLDKVYALRLGKTSPLAYGLAVKRAYRVTMAYWKFMRHSEPTVCLMPRWGDDLFRASALAYLSSASRRIGFSWDVVRGVDPAPYRDALLTDIVRGGSGMHEPVRFCLLASEAGLIPRSAVDQVSEQGLLSLKRMAEMQDWPMLAERLGIDRRVPFAVIAPGASHPKKMWPLERWLPVMDELKAMGLHVVLLSGPSDADVARDLQARSGNRATLVAGTTSLAESLTLLSQAALFLGNDSGPGHVAGALGIPTVALFITGPRVDPDNAYALERNRPMGPFVACCRPPHSIPPCEGWCSAPDAHCITLIEPEDVIRAATGVLERAKATRAELV